jgi:hypothetical protein
MPHPDMSPSLHLIDIQHGVGLNSGCYGCRWNLKLEHLNLLHKRGNHHCPLKLEILLPVGVLDLYDRVGTLIDHLPRCIKLLKNVVPCMLNITEAMIHDLQLLILV